MLHHRSPARRTSGAVALVLAALALPALAGPASALAAPTAADALEGACTDPAGVTVVVDKTDLGGEIEVGCADAPATGTQALQAAGFTDTRDAAGMICAIDALPDPCPAEFTGSYWSYWYAEAGGEWQTYMEGSDTAVPAAGAVEGWRYSDGTAGPGVEPAALLAATSGAAEETPAAEETAEADEPSDEETAEVTATVDEPAQDADEGPSTALVVAIVALAAALAGAVAVVLRRRRGAGA